MAQLVHKGITNMKVILSYPQGLESKAVLAKLPVQGETYEGFIVASVERFARPIGDGREARIWLTDFKPDQPAK
jgi:hypothetical protein